MVSKSLKTYLYFYCVTLIHLAIHEVPRLLKLLVWLFWLIRSESELSVFFFHTTQVELKLLQVECQLKWYVEFFLRNLGFNLNFLLLSSLTLET